MEVFAGRWSLPRFFKQNRAQIHVVLQKQKVDEVSTVKQERKSWELGTTADSVSIVTITLWRRKPQDKDAK